MSFPSFSAQRLLPPISISIQEIQAMICQNSEQTKLSSLKIIYDKGTEAQGVLALLVPVAL